MSQLETHFMLEGITLIVEKRRKPKKGIRSAELSELFYITCMHENTLWTPDEARVYSLIPKRNIGPGEIAFRMHALHQTLNEANLSLQGSRPCDVPELNLDVKTTNIRFGSKAIEAYGYVVMQIARELTIDFHDCINNTIEWEEKRNGRRQHELVSYARLISRGITVTMFKKFKLSGDPILRHIASRFQESLTRITDLVSFDAIAIVSPMGYIVIDRSDFNEAFEFKRISKSEPNFELSRPYLERRVKLHLSGKYPSNLVSSIQTLTG